MFSSESFFGKLRKLNLTLSFLSLFFILSIYREYQPSISSGLNINVIEITLTLIIFLTQAFIWSYYISALNNINLVESFFNWSYSQLGKFIPSGLMILSVRLGQSREIKKKDTVRGLLEEQLIAPLLVIPTVIINLKINLNLNPILEFVLTLSLLLAIFKYFYKSQLVNRVSVIDQWVKFLIVQTSQYALFYYISSSIFKISPGEIALYYLLSTNIGLLFIGVPSGIGIREGLFYLIVGTGFIGPEFFTYMVKIRILYFSAALIFGFIGFLNDVIKDKRN